jgi:hypothetical protein
VETGVFHVPWKLHKEKIFITDPGTHLCFNLSHGMLLELDSYESFLSLKDLARAAVAVSGGFAREAYLAMLKRAVPRTRTARDFRVLSRWQSLPLKVCGLTIPCNASIDEDLKRILGQNADFLTALWFEGKVTAATTVYCITSCANLTSLDLSGSTMDAHTLTVVVSCEKLQTLNITGCAVSETLFKELQEAHVHGQMSLTSLNVSKTKISPEWMRELFRTDAIKLRELDVSGCKLLTDVAFKIAARRGAFRQLTSISIASCKGLTCKALEVVIEHAPHLQRVDCSRTSVTDSTIDYLAETCKGSLLNLNIDQCTQLTDQAVLPIAQHCPNLTHLGISFKLKEETMLALAEIVHALTHLSLAFTSGMSPRVNQNNAILAVARANPALRSLSLRGHVLLSDEALAALAASCPCLERVELEGSNCLTDAGIQALVSCLRLKALLLIECAALSDAALEAIADGRECWLETLDVSYSAGFTAEGVVRVLARCRNLTAVTVRGNATIAGRVLEAMQEDSCCPALQHLCVSECTVDMTLLQQLQTRRPWLRIEADGMKEEVVAEFDDGDEDGDY